MSPKELREERGKLEKQMRDLVDKADAEKRDLTAEEDKQFNELHQRDAQLKRQLERADVLARMKVELDGPADPDPPTDPSGTAARGEGRRRERKKSEVSEEQRSLALAAWMRSQIGEPLKKRHVAAARAAGLRPNQRCLTIRLPGTQRCRELQRTWRSFHPNMAADKIHESRALSAFTASAGGILIPSTLLQSLEVNMLAFGGIRAVAEQIVTMHGEDMTWPTADDTGNEGEQLGESADYEGGGASVDPTFGGVVWGAYKFSSKPIRVPFELFEDEEFGLPTVLGAMLGERLGRITSKKYTTGPGANGPAGILTKAALGVTAASPTAIAAEELLELIHSVDPAYRNGAGFLLHDAVILHLRKLKDGNGQYLWQTGLRDGVPDRLLGYGVNISMEMPGTIEASAKTVLFGQLAKYKIRRVRDVRLYRLQERFRTTDEDGFIAFTREDGNLLDAGTAPVKYLQQAA